MSAALPTCEASFATAGSGLLAEASIGDPTTAEARHETGQGPSITIGAALESLHIGSNGGHDDPEVTCGLGHLPDRSQGVGGTPT
jgi:hypothetical protein